MFKIDDDVKMPEGVVQRENDRKYPWGALKVGQSFFVPQSEDPDGNLTKLRNRIYNAGREFARKRADGTAFQAIIVKEEQPNPEFGQPETPNAPEKIEVHGVRTWRLPNKEKADQ